MICLDSAEDPFLREATGTKVSTASLTSSREEGGVKPVDSDIARCNHRILSNFDLAVEGKLQNFIAKLGVVVGDSRRRVEDKFDILKKVVVERLEGRSESIESLQ